MYRIFTRALSRNLFHRSSFFTSRQFLILAQKSVNSSLVARPTSDKAMEDVDFTIYNRLAVQMDYYHSILRTNWNELYAGTEQKSSKITASHLIRIGLRFCQHLKAHHDIEEAGWFPVLGKKMSAFRDEGFAKEQHRQMHKGLDRLELYLRECQSGTQDFRRAEVRDIMASFGEALWTHLDAEVKELSGDSMRRYWTTEEMHRMPF